MSELPWHEQTFKKNLASTKRLLPQLEHILVQQNDAKQALRDTDHIHPSEMANEQWCPRATQYRITGVPESDPEYSPFKRLNIFAEGNAIHDKWQGWMAQAGILVGNWKCLVCGHKWWDKSPQVCAECDAKAIRYAEVPIFDAKHRVLGHADGAIEDDQGEALIELKSVGLGTIRYDAPNLYAAFANGNISLDELWNRIKRPLAAHNRQIQLYMYCTGVHDAIVIYEWKPTQEVREFAIKFEPSIVRPMLERCDEIIDALEEDYLLPRPENATAKSCTLCQYCSFRSTCWGKRK